MRLSLRSLFTPTDAGDEVARLIELRGRELEERSRELRAAVGELELREERTRELYARVEHILRDGALELDLRQEELAALASDLERREQAVAEAEERLEARGRELGAVELRRAAVERREEALRARELELETRARELDERAPVEAAREPAGRADEHVAILSADGYRVLVAPGPPPDVGAVVEAEGAPHRCVQLTTSPFPRDDRRCAVLEPVRAEPG